MYFASLSLRTIAFELCPFDPCWSSFSHFVDCLKFASNIYERMHQYTYTCTKWVSYSFLDTLFQNTNSAFARSLKFEENCQIRGWIRDNSSSTG